VVNAGRQTRLVQEHLDEFGLAREMLMQSLDRDEPLEAPHAGNAIKANLGHPACSELGDQLKSIEPPTIGF
jgi:hypothetical protein